MAENLEEGLVLLKGALTKKSPMDERKKEIMVDFIMACIADKNKNLIELARSDERVLAIYLRCRHFNELDIKKIDSCFEKVRNGDKLQENETISPREIAILRDIAFLATNLDPLNKLNITDKRFVGVREKIKKCLGMAEELGIGPELNQTYSGSFGFFQTPQVKSLKESFTRLKMLDVLRVDNPTRTREIK